MSKLLAEQQSIKQRLDSLRKERYRSIENESGSDIEAVLDCAEFNGHALASLRQGLKTIIYNGTANEAVDDIAAQLNATILRQRPESLDARLAETSGSLEDALRNWLNK